MNFFNPHTIWSDEYTVGVAALDQQHQHLFSLLGQIHALDTSDPAHALKSLPQMLDQLNEYAAFHLMFEESLMQKHLPPDAHTVAHITAHRQYWKEIAAFKQRLATGDAPEKLTLIHALRGFLDHWWRDHILKTDRQLGVKLNQCGVR